MRRTRVPQPVVSSHQHKKGVDIAVKALQMNGKENSNSERRACVQTNNLALLITHIQAVVRRRLYHVQRRKIGSKCC